MRRKDSIWPALSISVRALVTLTGLFVSPVGCPGPLRNAFHTTLPINGVNTNFFLAPERVNNEKVWDDVQEAIFLVMGIPGGRGNKKIKGR